MRRFYQFQFEDAPIEDGTIYWDGEVIGGELLVLREVVSNGVEHTGSNRPDADGRFALPDGAVSLDNLDPEGEIPTFEIGAAEFEAVWAVHCDAFRARWEQAKRDHPLGAAVAGRIEIFYPQGTIVRLSDEVFGVADDEATQAAAGRADCYPGHPLRAVVAGYDEANLWLVLDQIRNGRV